MYAQEQPALTVNSDSQVTLGPGVFLSYCFDRKLGETVVLFPYPVVSGDNLPTQSVHYTLVALWRYDLPADWRTHDHTDPGRWSAVVTTTARAATLLPGAPLRIADLAGTAPLPYGTYYVVARVNGAEAQGLIYNSPVECQDVDLGPPPPGLRAVCILDQDGRHATALFVRDPATLSAH